MLDGDIKKKKTGHTVDHDDPSILKNGQKHPLNSTCGRFLIMCLTLLVFALCCIGVTEWNEPEKRVKQESVFVLFGTIGGILFMYAVIPQMSRNAGMVSSDSWKPYFTCYRLSYLFAMPALICLGLGYGKISSFGTSPGSDTSIVDLKADRVGQHFILRDGFVGTNLTKSLVRTLNLHEHGDPPKTSRYQQAEYLLRDERQDFLEQGIEMPTLPPDTRTQYLIAPVFQNWEKCVTRQRISTLCVENNPIVAWAMAKTESLCGELGMLACKMEEPILDPVYHCSSADRMFKSSDNREGSYEGLCGRTIAPPDDPVIEQFLDIMRGEGWTDDRFPTQQLWIDVAYEECIGRPDECQSGWELVGLIGIILASLTGFCILATMVLDCQTDRQIRRARMWAQIKSKLPVHGPEVMRVQPQKTSYGNQSEFAPLQGDQSLRSAATSSDKRGTAIQDGTLGSRSDRHATIKV